MYAFIIAIMIVTLSYVYIRTKRERRPETFTKEVGSSCTSNSCNQCVWGCCKDNVCQSPTACFGTNYKTYSNVMLSDGVRLTDCIDASVKRRTSQVQTPLTVRPIRPLNPGPPTTVGTVITTTSVPVRDEGVIFAPYIMPGNQLIRPFVDTGGKWLTLAFCNWINNDMRWDSGDPDMSLIQYLRSKGGEVVVATGGYEGCRQRTEPGLAGGNAQQIFERYNRVVERFGSSIILDFDIEIGTESEARTYTVRNDALKILQARYPKMKLVLTVPCSNTSGVEGSLGMIRDATAKGVKFHSIRVMSFDYGNGSGDIVRDTIQCFTTTYRQIKDLGISDTAVGWTGMIPVDDNGRPQSLEDTRRIMAWVRGEGKQVVNMVAFWVLNKDNNLSYSKIMM